MKFQTKINKIKSLQDSKLKKLRLYNLAFKCMPNSYQQLEVKKEIEKLTHINI